MKFLISNEDSIAELQVLEVYDAKTKRKYTARLLGVDNELVSCIQPTTLYIVSNKDCKFWKSYITKEKFIAQLYGDSYDKWAVQGIEELNETTAISIGCNHI